MTTPHKNTSPLYHSIGPNEIQGVIQEFYKRAFADPIIGHFFFSSDKEKLVLNQIQFAKTLLGKRDDRSPANLKKIHFTLPIRKAHFDRRQVLMKEVLSQSNVTPTDQIKWLELEENLRRLIYSNREC